MDVQSLAQCLFPCSELVNGPFFPFPCVNQKMAGCSPIVLYCVDKGTVIQFGSLSLNGL